MSIKSQTLQTEYDFVCPTDPAIDTEVEGWREKYDQAIEVSDLDKMPLRPGAKPAVFRLRHLSRAERSYVLDTLGGKGPNQAADAAVRLALVGTRDASSSDGKPIRVERDSRVDAFKAAREETLDVVAAAYGGDALADIWHRVTATFSPRKG
jgi:hypothetical protein